MKDQRLVAEAVADVVAAAGIRHAFGHPGGEVVFLIDALRQAGVNFVLTRHEYTAALMAAGVGEYTGAPGLCLSTLGPGAANMVAGVAGAFLERAPQLALTGASGSGSVPGVSHQCIDLTSLYRPVTKSSDVITPASAHTAVQDALLLAARPRQGPVHLSISARAARSPAGSGANGAPGGQRGGEQAGTSPAPAVARAIRLLGRARRPAIIAGLGALRAGCADELRRLASALGAPVVLTPKVKGLVPDSSEWFAGVLEMAGDDLIVEFLQDADLVLCVGLDSVEFAKPWRITAPVIHADEVPNDGTYFTSEIDLVGPIASTLGSIIPSMERAGFWQPRQLAAHRSALDEYISGPAVGLTPYRMVKAVSRLLPPSAIATCDVGVHKLLVGQAWPTLSPQTFFMANGLSSMGYAIPVAVAIGLTSPSAQVVGFLGDGGLGMYLGELETCVRLGVHLLLVVFADGKLELIRRSQVSNDLVPSGTSFTNPDFLSLGKAFGFPVYDVSSLREAEHALAAAAGTRGLRMIVAEIDGRAYVV